MTENDANSATTENVVAADESEMVKHARETFEAILASQQAMEKVSRYTPAERAAIRAKKAKDMKKQEKQIKKDKIKYLNIRQLIRKQFPQINRTQAKNMADEFMAAKKEF